MKHDVKKLQNAADNHAMVREMTPLSPLCPCCTGHNARQNGSGPYLEFYCPDCDHTWYVSHQGSISQCSYENSAKYGDYYIGTPPFLWYHKLAQDYLLRHAAGGRILDFGCFDGFFTSRLLAAGLDAFGCDWNRKAINSGREIFGLGARLTHDPDGVFEAIVALEVIEHFNDPNNFFDVVLPHLAPSGLILLSCPNKNSIYRPKTDAPPHHFSRFSQTSLRRIVERRGMIVETHNVEMSSFQLLRNVIGDALRREAPLLGESSVHHDDGSTLRHMKRVANRMAGGTVHVLRPIDMFLQSFGLAYLSQFLVARRPQLV